MPTLEEIQATLRRELPYLRARYYIETLGVFGSYVHGEQTEESDVDLLVTFSQTPDLLDFVDMKYHLEDLLGLKVDLVTREALKRRKEFAPRILAEVRRI